MFYIEVTQVITGFFSKHKYADTKRKLKATKGLTKDIKKLNFSLNLG